NDNVNCVSCFYLLLLCFFFFSSRRRHTRFSRDWSSDVCSSDLFRLLNRFILPHNESIQKPKSQVLLKMMYVLEAGLTQSVNIGECCDDLKGFREALRVVSSC